MKKNDPLRHFAYEHLPVHLQNYSRMIHEVAQYMVRDLSPGAERNAGLRKLLEAKDCFFRAALEETHVVGVIDGYLPARCTGCDELPSACRCDRDVITKAWCGECGKDLSKCECSFDPITGNPLPKDSPYSQAYHQTMRYDHSIDRYIVTKDGVETQHKNGCRTIQFGECDCGEVKNDNDSV